MVAMTTTIRKKTKTTMMKMMSDAARETSLPAERSLVWLSRILASARLIRAESSVTS